ncbi:hypothetical protein QQF64_011675 [Cirrhinus molitorella]|uniref:Uncharacterized protein n=1 Tax=Cirrhinus molitorella TaxID=172907 RepID=A0ABR3M2H4_9TELE
MFPGKGMRKCNFLRYRLEILLHRLLNQKNRPRSRENVKKAIGQAQLFLKASQMGRVLLGALTGPGPLPPCPTPAEPSPLPAF